MSHENKKNNSKRKTTIREFLENQIPENLLDKVNRSFEIIGDIAICEISEELIEYEKKIGNAIMEVNTSINTVLKKSGIHGGEFRTQDLVYVAGENKKETIYPENGIRLMINPETVYFSARLSVERQNLMENLKENKKVLVMFSGIGPYTFVALKKQPNLARITSIELNPEGHKYAIENLKLNKNLIKKSNTYKNVISFLKENKLPIIEKIIISNLNRLKINQINGDVKEVCKDFNLVEFQENINNFHNNLFEQNSNDLFEYLKSTDIERLYFNFDEFKPNKNILNFLILFLEKFNYVIKINKTNYKFETDEEKGILLNYLEGLKFENITKFNEIYMPLPKDAELFLNSAFEVADKNCIIHMYDFVHENEFPRKSENAFIKAAEKFGKKVKIIETRKVGQYSPGQYRVCLDARVL